MEQSSSHCGKDKNLCQLQGLSEESLYLWKEWKKNPSVHRIKDQGVLCLWFYANVISYLRWGRTGYKIICLPWRGGEGPRRKPHLGDPDTQSLPKMEAGPGQQRFSIISPTKLKAPQSMLREGQDHGQRACLRTSLTEKLETEWEFWEVPLVPTWSTKDHWSCAHLPRTNTVEPRLFCSMHDV